MRWLPNDFLFYEVGGDKWRSYNEDNLHQGSLVLMTLIQNGCYPSEQIVGSRYVKFSSRRVER